MMGYLKNLLGAKEADSGKEAEQETTHALTWMNPDRSGTAPAARNGHTANLIESRIFIFGGGDKSDLYGDLHVFDVRDHSWSQPPCTGVAPPMRSRHSSAVVDRNLYIWGGIGGGIDVHVLDTIGMDWSTPIVAGVVPDSRFGHTCVAVDAAHAPRLFILGGHNSRQALSDLHVLEIGEQLSWTNPPVLGEPPILGNRHATVLIDDAAEAPLLACLLVFAADAHDTFGTLYALRYREGASGNTLRWVPQPTSGKPPLSRARPSLVVLDTHVFMLMGIAGGKPLSSVAMLNTHTYCWSMPILDGTSPPARMGATATRVGTDLYIFGGSDGRTSLRDLHVLVYVTWFTPSYAGKPPDCRVGHTSNFIGARLYVLGGASQGVAHNDLYVLDPNLQTWTRPPMYGTPPDALVGHSAVVLGSELIIWGGGDGKAAHAAFNVVDTLNMLWSRPTTSGTEPSARVGHSAVFHDSKMFVFGGYGQRQYWNELVALDTGILVWLRPHTLGQPPAPCVLHSATLVGHVMVVYGGSFNEAALNQLVAFDTVNMSWTNIGNYIWDGPRPLPLFGHGAVAIDHRLLIFGGTTGGVPDSLASYLFGQGFVTGYAAGVRNDLVVMDLQARTFSMPKYAGRRPPPAYRHTVSTRKGKIFVFGGVGGDGHMSLLDTGHAPGEVSSSGVLKKAPSTLDAAAAGLFAAEIGAEFGRTDGRGLDASRASQLVSLLQELDMNKYSRLFLRQEVDVESLLTLSDADLKDMGVTALGARRKLTTAIHKHKLQQMSEKGGGGSTAIKAGGAAAALAAAAATAMKAKNTAAAGSSSAESSSAADATPSRRTEDVDGRTRMALTHGFVTAGQVYRGRYLLNGKTYIGGSARVVLGEDIKTGQPIAVKVHSSRTYFAREMKLLRAMQSEYIVRFLDAFDEEDAPSAVVLEGGSCSLSEILAEGQLQPVERKHVLERLCLAVDFVHSRGFVLVDLKPANVVIFGSLLTFKLIDLECLRKNGDTVHFKLTPFYAAPELASAALETMRLGALPPLEYARARGPVDATSDQWGPNLGKGALLSESPTLARAVAQASSVVNTAGDVGDFNKDELRQLEAPLKLPNGKPLRAAVAMDIWAVGLIAFELFTNEPFFAGCSDDVALQVLASSTPLELPMARIADTQAQHLLAKILVKRPKERATIEMILRHAYLVGGLDTQQVGGSFAMLHESQNAFKTELDRLQAGLGPMGGGEAHFGSTAFGGGSSVLKKAHSGGSSGGGDRKARFAG